MSFTAHFVPRLFMVRFYKFGTQLSGEFADLQQTKRNRVPKNAVCAEGFLGRAKVGQRRIDLLTVSDFNKMSAQIPL